MIVRLDSPTYMCNCGGELELHHTINSLRWVCAKCGDAETIDPPKMSRKPPPELFTPGLTSVLVYSGPLDSWSKC